MVMGFQRSAGPGPDIPGSRPGDGRKDGAHTHDGPLKTRARRIAIGVATLLLSGWGTTAGAQTLSAETHKVTRMIEAHGFYGISDLHVDDAGAWRASAFKYDRRWQIDLDERGNLTSVPVGARGDFRPKKTDRAKAGIRLFLVLP